MLKTLRDLLVTISEQQLISTRGDMSIGVEGWKEDLSLGNSF